MHISHTALTDDSATWVVRPLWISTLDPMSRGYMVFIAVDPCYSAVALVAIDKARREGTLADLHQRFVRLGANVSDRELEQLYAEPPQIPRLH